MRQRERGVITGLVALLLILWLGFAVHRTPRFAGSAVGGILAVAGALLMVSAGAYSLVRRITGPKRAITQHITMRSLLVWHVYTGIFASIFGLLHTGHKFQSTLGIVLTAAMLAVVFTGYVGRYLLNYVSQEVREKRDLLSRLQIEYDAALAELRLHPAPAAALPLAGTAARILSSVSQTVALARSAGDETLARAIRLADAIADVEYSVQAHDTLKVAFSRWLRIHIAASILLYLLLGLHIWSGIRYGLRWFES